MHVSYPFIASNEAPYTVSAVVTSDAPDHRSYSIGFESIVDADGEEMPESLFSTDEGDMAEKALEEARKESQRRPYGAPYRH